MTDSMKRQYKRACHLRRKRKLYIDLWCDGDGEFMRQYIGEKIVMLSEEIETIPDVIEEAVWGDYSEVLSND